MEDLAALHALSSNVDRIAERAACYQPNDQNNYEQPRDPAQWISVSVAIGSVAASAAEQYKKYDDQD
jgi:hypothetical protein